MNVRTFLILFTFFFFGKTEAKVIIHYSFPFFESVTYNYFGWNALYAASNVEQFRENAFNRLLNKAQKKCKEGAAVELISELKYDSSYVEFFREHAFGDFRCKND